MDFTELTSPTRVKVYLLLAATCDPLDLRTNTNNMPKKVLVGYGIDVDAVSGWLNSTDGTPADVANISRGVFGATVGTDRLLKLLKQYNIKASWYIPAHSIESFPEQMAKVRDAGHEM